MHAIKLAWYLARLVVFRLLAIVRFFSKPGSRIIVPVLLAGAMLLLRSELHDVLEALAWQLDPQLQPDWLILDIVLVLLFVVLRYIYITLSEVLAVLLGAFPVEKRPLPPVRRMKPTTVQITPAVVRVVVPALPRRQPAREGL